MARTNRTKGESVGTCDGDSVGALQAVWLGQAQEAPFTSEFMSVLGAQEGMLFSEH